MSSDLYFYGSSLYHRSSPEMVSSDGDLFFPDPFSPFCDSSTEIFQDFSNNQNTQSPPQNSNLLDNFSLNLLSSSPPSHQLENLSLYQTTARLQHQPLANVSSSWFPGLDVLGVKTEECQMSFDPSYSNKNQFFMPHSHTSGMENVTKIMQRSYSSNSFEGKPDVLFQPHFDTLLESSSSSPNYHQNQTLSPPENTFLAGHMRRVCSTGDLQNTRTAHTITTQRSFSSPSGTESSFTEEANFKVGRYSAEERKDRISKYRAKRNQRNFTKTIKYACRKTLADNRPRIRGRFARNDETGEIPKAACSSRHEDEDELWFDGVHIEEDDGGIIGGGDFVNTSYGQAQFQYYSY
ncbi:two-component response regulator-like PRR37 [Ricinus communis]|uniref:CCT domain-containing protein n=1 Tax=Ricinus communis TaxID=3988 RepID=B9RCF2_RICCO|nr:two-component response regulator-like PRR37 [Ricinus communis]EEF51223.1 conserved hypothetical protein [Ricinus communis]|eukprot:XP_002509836.1 two-component response regulator-like PRR37 [Ricinus communis]